MGSRVDGERVENTSMSGGWEVRHVLDCGKKSILTNLSTTSTSTCFGVVDILADNRNRKHYETSRTEDTDHSCVVFLLPPNFTYTLGPPINITLVKYCSTP